MPARRLTRWYAQNRRAMPWRANPEPYFCWLSEIMLQQTTYEQALPYYERFLARFPTVESLAAADEQDVLKAWAGLGYYARARNLHRAAQQIAATRWPANEQEWASVPGVGPYTAAALASVLNGEPAPVVDGNVARVFARYWLLSEDFRKLPPRRQLANRLKASLFQDLGRKKIRAGDLNQAMMELGALVCTPKSPRCAECPLRDDCAAYAKGVQEDYPVRAPRRPIPVRRVSGVVVTDDQGRVLLVRNVEGGLLKGLWELPVLDHALDHVQVFSHFRLELSVERAGNGAVFVNPAEVPLTTATRKVLIRLGVLALAGVGAGAGDAD